MSSYQSSLVLFIPYIMWIPEIHHAIYSTRCLCIQLGFVVFQRRGVILRKTNTKQFSYFIQVAERNQTKICGAARLWLSLQAHSTERFQMCQQSCPLQLARVLLILPKWKIWVGHCRDHDSCHGSTDTIWRALEVFHSIHCAWFANMLREARNKSLTDNCIDERSLWAGCPCCLVWWAVTVSDHISYSSAGFLFCGAERIEPFWS